MLRLKWILAGLTGLALCAGLSAIVLPWSRFYENELCPWLPPNRSLQAWKADAALRTPLAMCEYMLGSNPDLQRKKLIALTFDDGPYPLYTPLLLEVLEHYHVRATFFVVGCHVNEYPELTRQIARSGHELANHTYTHRREGELGPGELEEELNKTRDVVKKASGQTINLFRPAGGNMTPRGLATVQNLGYTMVNATVNAGDWWVQDPDQLLRDSLRGRSREGVVLMHSGRLGIIRTLPGYINSLRAKGFRFVTVSELAAACNQ
jgi:peptidoglycan/xylan/chitin deacetylase (PgdA/CDA1 family)